MIVVPAVLVAADENVGALPPRDIIGDSLATRQYAAISSCTVPGRVTDGDRITISNGGAGGGQDNIAPTKGKTALNDWALPDC